jgi:hypothetical protein
LMPVALKGGIVDCFGCSSLAMTVLFIRYCEGGTGEAIHNFYLYVGKLKIFMYFCGKYFQKRKDDCN